MKKDGNWCYNQQCCITRCHKRMRQHYGNKYKRIIKFKIDLWSVKFRLYFRATASKWWNIAIFSLNTGFLPAQELCLHANWRGTTTSMTAKLIWLTTLSVQPGDSIWQIHNDDSNKSSVSNKDLMPSCSEPVRSQEQRISRNLQHRQQEWYGCNRAPGRRDDTGTSVCGRRRRLPNQCAGDYNCLNLFP